MAPPHPALSPFWRHGWSASLKASPELHGAGDHVGEDLHHGRLVHLDGEPQVPRETERRGKSHRHGLHEGGLQQHEPKGILLQQSQIARRCVGHVGDVGAVDVEDHEGKVVGASLLRHLGAQEHARPLQVHEHESARGRGRLESLRPSRIADAGSTGGSVGLRSGWGLSALRHVDLLFVARRGRSATVQTLITRRAHMLAELQERDATGEIAVIYEEIRRFWAVPYVSSLQRHLATRPGWLEWTWDSLRPVFASGIAQLSAWRAAANLKVPPLSPISHDALRVWGVSAEAEDLVRATCDSFVRVSPVNLVLSGLLRRLLRGERPTGPLGRSHWTPPAALGPLPT